MERRLENKANERASERMSVSLSAGFGLFCARLAGLSDEFFVLESYGVVGVHTGY